MKIFVGGLPSDIDDVDLKEMFELYGEVSSAKIILDKETGRSRGFGFVDMPDSAEARQTIELLDGVGMKGKKLSVKEAETQAGGAPRSNMGGSRFNDNRRPPNRRY